MVGSLKCSITQTSNFSFCLTRVDLGCFSCSGGFQKWPQILSLHIFISICSIILRVQFHIDSGPSHVTSCG